MTFFIATLSLKGGQNHFQRNMFVLDRDNEMNTLFYIFKLFSSDFVDVEVVSERAGHHHNHTLPAEYLLLVRTPYLPLYPAHNETTSLPRNIQLSHVPG